MAADPAAVVRRLWVLPWALLLRAAVVAAAAAQAANADQRRILTAGTAPAAGRPLVVPSILAADFGHLVRDARAAERAGCSWLHVDVCDGVFVPGSLTLGPQAVSNGQAGGEAGRRRGRRGQRLAAAGFLSG